MDSLAALTVERLAALRRLDLRHALSPHVAALRRATASRDGREHAEQALATCRSLYAQGRSDEGLALAASALACARRIGDPVLLRRALNTCGILSADAFDIVGALEYHLQSLKVTSQQRDMAEQAGVWNNVGLAMALAGSPGMAACAYRRALQTAQDVPGPAHARYAACCNMANSLFHVGEYEEGLRYGTRALQEMTPEFATQDPNSVILLRRNLVNLLVALSRADEARAHVDDIVRLAARNKSPRAYIAAATARAVHELATGHLDVALTRLDQALACARETPPALRDTLVCLIRAEEAAGFHHRALARLQELSEHVYRFALERALRHVELADLEEGLFESQRTEERTRSRLVAHLERPEPPPAWEALRRLAVSASLRFDPTGSHGLRVGTLARALALASGQQPLQALEIGLAAELHDIGMLSVPEGILHKRTALNSAEQDAYFKHASAGADMLRDDRYPRVHLAREMAAYHHASWDGSGHPAKVAGRQIPLAARICAVADAYDELAFGINARGGVPTDEALKGLAYAAGRRLDPELVRIFDGVVREEVADHELDTLDGGGGLEQFHELIALLRDDKGYA